MAPTRPRPSRALEHRVIGLVCMFHPPRNSPMMVVTFDRFQQCDYQIALPFSAVDVSGHTVGILA